MMFIPLKMLDTITTQKPQQRYKSFANITCIFIKKKKNRQNSLLWLKQTTTTLQFGLAEKEQWFLLGETNNDQGYRLLTI